jgi:DNA-binding transcriptional MerR regulator
MQIVGLKPAADQLGITTSKLRYFLERVAVVPYRKLDLGGRRHVRYFTPDDNAAINQWWETKDKEK